MPFLGSAYHSEYNKESSFVPQGKRGFFVANLMACVAISPMIHDQGIWNMIVIKETTGVLIYLYDAKGDKKVKEGLNPAAVHKIVTHK